MVSVAERFSVAEDMPALPAAVRHLDAGLSALADQAVTDGATRKGPNDEDTVKALGAMNRYLNRKGFRIRQRPDGAFIYWDAVKKQSREITAEHKAKMQAGRKAALAAKGNGTGTPTPTPPSEHKRQNGQKS